MLPTHVIEDYEALPPEAQQQVIDFVAFMKSRYHSLKQGMLDAEIEDSFGILVARKSVTLEEMDKVIRQRGADLDCD